jgi:hypothetical protein
MLHIAEGAISAEKGATDFQEPGVSRDLPPFVHFPRNREDSFMTFRFFREAWVIAVLLCLPVLATAGTASRFDHPDTGYAANVAIDIVKHHGGVWLATGRGINYSFDGGRTWLIYDSSNGLYSNDISALFSINDTLWVATNHYQFVNVGGANIPVVISDGVSYTADDGNTWHRIIFDSTGLNIPRVWGGDRTIYDIAGANFQGKQWRFFAAFAGGLLASQDGGIHWRRVFRTAYDSVLFYGNTVPPVGSRFFSCVTDTSHGDSLFTWVGTAGGVFQYIFASPRSKIFIDSALSIALCNDCSPDSGFVYIAGNTGITRSQMSGPPFITRNSSEGLPGNYVSKTFEFGRRVFVGTGTAGLYGPSGSSGLAHSDDFGDTYTADTLSAVQGDVNRLIEDFAPIRNRLYMAAGVAGLFVSSDTGATWSHLFVDSTDTTSANRRNAVHALSPLGDTLRVGTDSGLVSLYLDTSGAVDSSAKYVFDDIFGAKVAVIRTLVYRRDTLNPANDSIAIWTINRALTVDGRLSVNRSIDGGKTWSLQLGNLVTRDIANLGDSTIAVGDYGIAMMYNDTVFRDTFPVYDSIVGTRIDTSAIRSIAVRGDTVILAGRPGIAYSNDRGKTFKVFRSNVDTLAADAVVNYTATNTINIDTGSNFIYGLTGNFIPALAVQPIPGRTARIWASGRPADAGFDGITVARYVAKTDTLGHVTHKLRWDALIPDNFAWNYAFMGDTTFAATNKGLLMCTNMTDSVANDASILWDTIPFVDTAGRTLVGVGKAALAVRVIDSFLWVGTEQGTVRINMNDPSFRDQQLFTVIDTISAPDQVYAFPVPFSPNRGIDNTVKFHFRVENASGSYVTLEVYDFAMNLVARVFDNRFFPKGIYHGNAGAADVPEWDGHNGRGDIVATGVYYFKVAYSTGEVRWGKLAVIP